MAILNVKCSGRGRKRRPYEPPKFFSTENAPVVIYLGGCLTFAPGKWYFQTAWLASNAIRSVWSGRLKFTSVSFHKLVQSTRGFVHSFKTKRIIICEQWYKLGMAMRHILPMRIDAHIRKSLQIFALIRTLFAFAASAWPSLLQIYLNIKTLRTLSV